MSKKIEKPLIMKDASFRQWCLEQKCDLREGCEERHEVFCEATAQWKVDVAYYEPLLEQAQEQIDYISIKQKAIERKLDDVELAIQQAKAEVARGIDGFLQMHLCARPDEPIATIKFSDWVKLKKLLSKYTGGQK